MARQHRRAQIDTDRMRHTDQQLLDGQDVDLASSQRLEFGILRKGSDGPWRWVGNARRFDPTKYRRCATPNAP